MEGRQDEGIRVRMSAPCVLQKKAGPGPGLLSRHLSDLWG